MGQEKDMETMSLRNLVFFFSAKRVDVCVPFSLMAYLNGTIS